MVLFSLFWYISPSWCEYFIILSRNMRVSVPFSPSQYSPCALAHPTTLLPLPLALLMQAIIIIIIKGNSSLFV